MERTFKVGQKVKCKFGTRTHLEIIMVMNQVEHYNNVKQCLVDAYDGATPFMWFANEDNLVLDDWPEDERVDDEQK